ncbi:winged helix-turn-helix transcriptional regulator [Weissella minor]|uniref:MarR family winged helix-turn-helix transcriptional regulator n=1 Tax=Weissella minor TaxID=1620 RepID=UPI001BB0BF4B|nr:MarR family winged helix-turn-helix transcriptional regulator [Weissella minor]MBS0949312.1 winged helix-turn-helix transcriptional regulator [Weissella minor]
MKQILDALQVAEKQYRTNLIQMAKGQGVTVAEWTLLGYVNDGYDTQDKLSKGMALDNSTLSRQLKSLVKKELVESEVISHDNRQLRYRLTQKGLDTMTALVNAQAEFNNQVFSVWSDEEKRMMEILLNRLDKSINKIA